jgi:hypothetical protein
VEPELSSLEYIRGAAVDLSRLRGRPCLLLSTTSLTPCAVTLVARACADRTGDIDLLIHGPGGCICCAYAIAREIRRHFTRVGAFVPGPAKSAATLVALVADELVLGTFGELGPLDAQRSQKQRADFPVERSCLDWLCSLDQLQGHAVGTFDTLVRHLLNHAEMRGEDVFRVSGEFVAQLLTPLYSQIDPGTLGECVRQMELGRGYADRLLRRYRPDLYADRGPAIIERLVSGYAAHSFVIDREELEELGIPTRHPEPEESVLLDQMAPRLKDLAGQDLIEIVCADDPCRTRECEHLDAQFTAATVQCQRSWHHALVARLKRFMDGRSQHSGPAPEQGATC